MIMVLVVFYCSDKTDDCGNIQKEGVGKLTVFQG